jgi:hypothetical protein
MIEVEESAMEPKPIAHDPLRAVAITYALYCGFTKPVVRGAVKDMAAPGMTAYWIDDEWDASYHMGILISSLTGIVEEFYAKDHPVGVLPDGGFKTFFAED